MGEISVRVLVVQEGDTWVAQALEYDIGAQAQSLDCLKERFAMTLEIDLEESLRRTGVPFGGIDAAPDHYFVTWEKVSSDFTSMGEMPSTNTAHIGYEMKIAA